MGAWAAWVAKVGGSAAAAVAVETGAMGVAVMVGVVGMAWAAVGAEKEGYL